MLGYVVPDPPPGFASWQDFDRSLPAERQGSAFACVDPSGRRTTTVLPARPGRKAAKNRPHLDVRIGLGLVGAVRVRLLAADGIDESCIVMRDVECNEFCLD